MGHSWPHDTKHRCLRFVARLTRVADRDDHLNFYCDHILLGLNETCPLDPLSGNTHI